MSELDQEQIDFIVKDMAKRTVLKEIEGLSEKQVKDLWDDLILILRKNNVSLETRWKFTKLFCKKDK